MDKLKIGDDDVIIYRIDFEVPVIQENIQKNIPEIFEFGCFIQQFVNITWMGLGEENNIKEGLQRLLYNGLEYKFSDITTPILKCELDLEDELEQFKTSKDWYSYLDTIEFNRYLQSINIDDINKKLARGKRLSVFEDMQLENYKNGIIKPEVIFIEVNE